MKEDNAQDSGEKWGTQWTSRSDAAIAQERAEKRASSEKIISRSERWSKAQPSKAMLVWCCLGAVALTMLVGFRWGGWQTTKGATAMAVSASNAAVVEQLAPICVAQFNLDPAHSEKLVVLKETPTYQQAAYVTEQQWATMPGAEKPVSKVADACARLLVAE